MSSTKDKKTSGWPTLEEQLAAAKAIPGSALDKLIRENQDLHMLDPQELHDMVRLPPWLRVYWRKKHPEVNKKGPIPYPPLLRRLRQWMSANQALNEDLISMKPAGEPK
jgi:hypothetical protein